MCNSKRRYSIELVIPSFNRPMILKNTIGHIRLVYPDLSICVGLQGEIDNWDFLYELVNVGSLRVECLSSPSTTSSMNQCIESSAADIIVCLDDDALPHVGWLEAHLEAFEKDHDLVYTSGRVVEFRTGRSGFSEFVRIISEWVCGLLLPREIKINGRIIGWINGFGLMLANPDQPGSCRINCPREGNMGLRREAFKEMGGFNTAFVGNAWGFGADFGLRLAKAGRYGRYLGDAIIVHYQAESGGSRQLGRGAWFRDFLHNHRVLMQTLGRQGWLGSLPRLAKKIVCYKWVQIF